MAIGSLTVSAAARGAHPGAACVQPGVAVGGLSSAQPHLGYGTSSRSLDAVLCSPPPTQASSPLAVFRIPPLIDAPKALAAFSRPPLIDELNPLAVFRVPPLTDEVRAVALFS